MTITLGEATLGYDIIGSGRPLLCVHGYSVDRRLMKGCMERLFPGGGAGGAGNDSGSPGSWQRIYVDLPGMGESTAPLSAACSDRILDSLLAFIDAVIPGRHFALAGESYGGYLARAIVRKRGLVVDGLLLLCPMILPDRGARELPDFRVMCRETGLCESLSPRERKMFESDTVVQTRRTWNRYRDEILPAFSAGDRRFQQVMHEPAAYPLSFDVDRLDTPFDRPALFLLGRQDSVVGYRDAWNLIESYPRATFAVLDRAGHNLQIEQEGLFAALAGEWLERIAQDDDCADTGGLR